MVTKKFKEPETITNDKVARLLALLKDAREKFPNEDQRAERHQWMDEQIKEWKP